MRKLQTNKEKKPCSSNQISGKQQWDEQCALGVKVIQMTEENAPEREPIASQEDFSCSLDGSSVEMDEAYCEEQPSLTNSPTEGSAKSCRIQRKGSKTNMRIKPCSVLLKNIDCEFKKGHEYCLIPPNTQKLPQKIRNARKIGNFKALQAGLYDLLDRHRFKRQGVPQNPATFPENKEVNQVESGLEGNSSAKVLIFTACDKMRKLQTNKEKRTCSSNQISGKQQWDEQCALGVKVIQMTEENAPEREPIASQEDFSCSPDGSRVEMDEACCEEQPSLTNSPTEGSAKSCRIQRKSSKTNMRIKPCSVLLKNIDCEFKKGHEYCLIPPNTQKLPQKIGNARKIGIFKALQAGLYDLLDRHRFKRQGVPQNPATFPENKEVNQVESGLEGNSSAKVLSKETNSDVKNAERKANFPDSSTVCGNSFETFSFIKSDLEISTAGLCHAQETEKGANSLEIDSVMVPETQHIVSFEPTEKWEGWKSMENGKTLIKQTVRKESSHGTYMFVSECPGETSSDNTRQPSRIDMIPVTSGGTLQASRACKRIQNGDHSDVPPSGCQSFQDYVTNIKHSVVKKETELNGREISHAEECGNSQPAKENSLVGELCPSTVKLLGTPRDNSKTLCLNRLIELENSSDSEVQSNSHSMEYQESRDYSPSLNKEIEGSLYSTEVTWHKPLYSDDSRAVNRRAQRPNKRRALIHPSKLSQEECRIKVVDALKEVLQKRLDDSPDLGVQGGTVLRIAKKVEKALFDLSCCVDQHYKNKYRSLLFNLKSPKNQCLFNKVILGVISPKRLVQMSALELAPEELSEWRAREHKYALELIEKEEREVTRCCLTKFTHKGIIEIPRETNEDLMFKESQLLEDENSLLEAPAASMRYSGVPDHDGRFKPPTQKGILKQKVNAFRYLASTAVYSDRGERQLEEVSPISGSIPNEHLQVRNQSRTSVIWRGVIKMFSLKPFAAKAYLVSGSKYHLFQAIPDLLQSRGCILPEDIWEYLDSIWPANTKEMALIRFQPSLRKGCNPYNMLYSYLNKKQRYGIVDSNQMELFMVPLAAYQPISSKLHPLGDPGLDPCHPSLLLGLILPKRPPTWHQPLPKANRKRVTFKDNIETCFFPPPSQADTCQMEPPSHLSLSEPLWGHNCPTAVLPRPDPLPSEELGSKVFQGDLCSSHFVTAGSGTIQSLLDALLQSQCDSPSIDGQLGNLTLETLGAQSQQAGNQIQFCSSPDPLGLLLPSVCPNQGVEEGAHRAKLSDAPLVLNELRPEAVSPAEVSQAALPPQILSTTPLAGDTHMLVEEAFSLIQYMTQLPSHRTLSQQPEPPPVFGFPKMPQETTSALSPAAAGLEFPVAQQGEDMDAQLQLLLSILGGQSQSPSTS